MTSNEEKLTALIDKAIDEMKCIGGELYGADKWNSPADFISNFDMLLDAVEVICEQIQDARCLLEQIPYHDQIDCIAKALDKAIVLPLPFEWVDGIATKKLVTWVYDRLEMDN